MSRSCDAKNDKTENTEMLKDENPPESKLLQVGMDDIVYCCKNDMTIVG